MAATSGTLQALPASMLARNEIIDLSIAHAELVKENVRLCRWIPDILVVGKATAAIRSRNRAVHGRDATSADTSTALCQSAAMWTGGGADANAAMGWSSCCAGPAPPALATEPSRTPPQMAAEGMCRAMLPASICPKGTFAVQKQAGSQATWSPGMCLVRQKSRSSAHLPPIAPSHAQIMLLHSAGSSLFCFGSNLPQALFAKTIRVCRVRGRLSPNAAPPRANLLALPACPKT